MSNYLQIKMRRAFKEVTDQQESLDDKVSEGMDSLKEGISKVENEGGYVPFLTKPEVEPNYKGTELAEVAVGVYKTNIKPKEKKAEVKPEQTLPAIRHDMRALSRSLCGMRNGGDEGRPSYNAGPNGGSVGIGGKSVALMSMEEYEAHINGVPEVDEPEIVEQEPEFLQEGGAIADLEKKLLEMSDTSWQSIDKEMRKIAKEYDMTPKELHKAFKEEHDGMIPDDWAKEHQQIDECGWMPLEEASLMKTGQAYDVSLIWKGHTRRLKFFWPSLHRPDTEDMQKACEMFYPGSKLITYYVTNDSSNNFMVLVPPIKESNFVFYPEDWVELTEEQEEAYNIICEEEGEPIDHIQLSDEGELLLLIEDHDTGEEKVVSLGEAYKDLPKRKMGMKAGKKIISAMGHAAKAGAEDEGTIENQVRIQKANKKGNQAQRIHDVAKKHSPAKSKLKSIKNQLTGMTKEEVEIYEDDMKGMSQKSGDKRSTESGAGMTAQGVAKYRRRNPGSKLQTAVTGKVKPGSKAAGRRKSFCARSRGWNGERGKAARRRWKC